MTRPQPTTVGQPAGTGTPRSCDRRDQGSSNAAGVGALAPARRDSERSRATATAVWLGCFFEQRSSVRCEPHRNPAPCTPRPRCSSPSCTPATVAMPSPMSGRGKEFMGYRISDTALLVGALAIFAAVRARSVASRNDRLAGPSRNGVLTRWMRVFLAGHGLGAAPWHGDDQCSQIKCDIGEVACQGSGETRTASPRQGWQLVLNLEDIGAVLMRDSTMMYWCGAHGRTQRDFAVGA